MTGTDETRLIVIRGNSGSGKSSLARAIRRIKPREIAIVGQDVLRQDILHVRDEPDNGAIGLIDLTARYDLPFDETLRRHASKEVADRFGAAEMRQWWREKDSLSGIEESTIAAEQSLKDAVQRIVIYCGW